MHCPFGTKIDQLSDRPMVKKLLFKKKKDNNNKEIKKERNKITSKRHEELSKVHQLQAPISIW